MCSEEKKLFASGAAIALYHSQDRPDTQFGAARLMGAIIEPKVRDELALKIHARCLLSFPESSRLFVYQSVPKEILVVTDAEWAEDGSD